VTALRSARAAIVAGLRSTLSDRQFAAMQRLHAKLTTHRALRRADRMANQQADSWQACAYLVSEAGVPHAYGYFVEWLEEHDPTLRRRIWLGHLPERPPAHATVVHAWLQDPVRERDAEVFRQATAVEDEIRARAGTVIQPARVLSNSMRTELERRLSSAGFRTPRTVCVDFGASDPLHGLQPPFVLRKPWGHLVPMTLCRTPAEAAPLLEDARVHGDPLVASEYIETVSPDGLYRKFRYLMLGSVGQPRHMIASINWEVRPKDRVLDSNLRDEELAFVNGPCALHDAFDAGRRALEFDVAAFDYSFDHSGTPVVWEVNPFPDLSIPSPERAPHLRETGLETFRLMADFYRNALITTSLASHSEP
jgi:hypothetical protein